MTGPLAKLRRAEVTALRSAVEDGVLLHYVTVRVPAEAGTTRSLEIPCPPHFAPEVGDTVTLAMSGAVPTLFPDVIAADSITAREIIAGTITALLVDGDSITFGDYPGGYYGVLDSTGIRLFNGADGDVQVFTLDALTGDALFTGVIQTAVDGYRLRLWPSDDAGSRIDFFAPDTAVGDEDSPAAHTARIYSEGVGDGEQALTLQAGLTTGVTNQGSLLLDPAGNALLAGMQADLAAFGNGLTLRVRADATGASMYGANAVLRIQADATGIGFYGTTPVAKPDVTGSRDGNAALASLLTALASQGLIIDSTTA